MTIFFPIKNEDFRGCSFLHHCFYFENNTKELKRQGIFWVNWLISELVNWKEKGKSKENLVEVERNMAPYS